MKVILLRQLEVLKQNMNQENVKRLDVDQILELAGQINKTVEEYREVIRLQAFCIDNFLPNYISAGVSAGKADTAE